MAYPALSHDRLHAIPPRLRKRLTPLRLHSLLPLAADHAAAELALSRSHAIAPEGSAAELGPRDAIVLDEPDPDTAARDVFPQLRWGGVALLATRSPARLEALRNVFAQTPGYRLEADPVQLPHPHPLLRRVARTYHACIARKVLLDPPDTLTSRYSYHLSLEPAPDQPHGYAVVKRVPTLDQAIARLRALDPTADAGFLERTAVGLVRKAFPVFLTREAAFLMILRRHLPEPMRPRVPEALDLEKDDQGHVRSLTMTWLRQGHQTPTVSNLGSAPAETPASSPMPLLEFARQTAELLDALHTHVRVMHLDLRLDNLLVTPQGVSIIDFGSAIRFGEDITQSRVLAKVFAQMLDASQIADDLRRLRQRKRVTSSVFRHCFQAGHPGYLGPAIDLFALTHQMTRPHDNPDLLGLVNADPNQPGYDRLAQLRRDILKPKHPDQPSLQTVRDLAEALQAV
ncbi:MAG: serine/threonine-protein kinase [Planctomycetota bacterium]